MTTHERRDLIERHVELLKRDLGIPRFSITQTLMNREMALRARVTALVDATLDAEYAAQTKEH